MTTYKITNEEKFNQVNDVDVTGLKWRGTDSRNNDLGYYGSLEIETEADGYITTTGEFGKSDYETEFGFILIQE